MGEPARSAPPADVAERTGPSADADVDLGTLAGTPATRRGRGTDDRATTVCRPCRPPEFTRREPARLGAATSSA
ncbi:hypothetical protein FTX61_15275 [Nitriliruptoraceae bacterium ZYF776]|nr:hypothetical protein [Profundirhabdus halotolerans]